MKSSQGKSDEGLVRVQMTLELSTEMLEWLDALKVQLGMESRGKVVTLLLNELVPERSCGSSDRPASHPSQA